VIYLFKDIPKRHMKYARRFIKLGQKKDTMNNKIANSWASFAERVVPEDAGENQKIESKRCFYAGCVGVLKILLNVDEDTSSEESVDVIEGLFQECEQFQKDIKGGKA